MLEAEDQLKKYKGKIIVYLRCYTAEQTTLEHQGYLIV